MSVLARGWACQLADLAADHPDRLAPGAPRARRLARLREAVVIDQQVRSDSDEPASQPIPRWEPPGEGLVSLAVWARFPAAMILAPARLPTFQAPHDGS